MQGQEGYPGSKLLNSYKQRMYYGFRTMLLAASIILTVIWFFMGFDSTAEQIIFSNQPGLGTHWSTIQSLTLLAYFLSINFQLGGVTSLKQLLREVKRDLRSIIGDHAKEYIELGYVVDPVRAMFPIAFIPLFAVFLFEVPYVFLLNYYQFGDWFFPVYMYETNFLSGVFYRNFGMFFAAPLTTIAVLKVKNHHQKYAARIDRVLLLLGVLTLLSWAAWILYPSDYPVQTIDSLGLNQSETWTLPKQELFPQNTYIYMSVPLGTYYTREQLNGWHHEEWQVHLLNIVTKYMVFLTVGFASMVKIKPKQS